MNKLDIKKGSFTKQAKRHKMSIDDYANYVIKHRKSHRKSGYNPTLKTYRRAILYKTFKKTNKRSNNKRSNNKRSNNKHSNNKRSNQKTKKNLK